MPTLTAVVSPSTDLRQRVTTPTSPRARAARSKPYSTRPVPESQERNRLMSWLTGHLFDVAAADEQEEGRPLSAEPVPRAGDAAAWRLKRLSDRGMETQTPYGRPMRESGSRSFTLQFLAPFAGRSSR